MKKAIALLTLALLPISSLMAEVVYVSARTPGSTTGPAGANNNTTYGIYTELAGATWSDTTSKSSVSDLAGAAFARPGSRFRSSVISGMGFSIKPQTAVVGGVYKIEATFNASLANGSTDILVDVSSTDGTLSTAQTTAFQRSVGGDKWGVVGYITNNVDVASPTITFVFNSGTVDGTHRWLVDMFRVTLVESCLDVPQVKVTGPLYANGPTVIVTNVAANATALKVYQKVGNGNMTLIGSLTSGLTTTNNAVPVTGLVKGAIVSATQTINGQEGCVQNTGTLVGGGANPRLRLALNIKETTSTGPIGTTGASSSDLHFLGTATRIAGAPGDGHTIYPSNTWQTVTFLRGPDPVNPTDPSVKWNSSPGSPTANGTTNALTMQWATIDGLAIANDDTNDCGPFVIYIDKLENGTTVIEDFEAATNGAPSYGFFYPTFSGSSVGVLSWPNSTEVTDVTSASGTKSLKTYFQFSGTDRGNWLRFTTAGVSQGISNPQVDLNEPITFKILLLPVGATPPPPSGGAPTLGFSKAGNQITFSWTGSFILQEATSVTGPWTDVNGAVTGHQVSTATGTKFYRLKQ